MKDYSCELGAACGPEAAAGRELAAVRKRRCVAEEAQVAGEGDELLLLLFVRAVVRDDAHLFGYVGEARHLTASGRITHGPGGRATRACPKLETRHCMKFSKSPDAVQSHTHA